jgi:hypothetical protein
MAILNFPANPSVDETYEENGIIYTCTAENIAITASSVGSTTGVTVTNYTADAEL